MVPIAAITVFLSTKGNRTTAERKITLLVDDSRNIKNVSAVKHRQISLNTVDLPILPGNENLPQINANCTDKASLTVKSDSKCVQMYGNAASSKVKISMSKKSRVIHSTTPVCSLQRIGCC